MEKEQAENLSNVQQWPCFQRVKPERYEVLNKAVKKWFLILRSENVSVSGPMLRERALEFAKELNMEGFQASEGWLDKWKKRYCLHFFSLCF